MIFDSDKRIKGVTVSQIIAWKNKVIFNYYEES